MNRLPQILGGVAAVAVLLLVALYVARPHQTEVSSPSARGPTAARSVYPSIEVDTPQPPTTSPDTSPRVLDIESGDVQVIDTPSDLTFASALVGGSLLFANGSVGPAKVVGTDESLIATLDVPATTEYRTSVDQRYVAWLSVDDQIQVYDAQTNDIASTLPRDLRFEQAMADGAVLLPTPAGTAIVDPDGTFEKTVAATDWQVTISKDGRRLAWLASSGLHIYDRETHAETTNNDVQWAHTSLAWSPDATKIAYERLTGDNAVHVEVLDIASGAQREVYAGALDVRIEQLRFLSAHRLEFHLKSGDFARFGDIGGARYQVNDDGTDGRLIDQPGTEWDYCGPTCGLPPERYESDAGVAQWCQMQVDKTCVLHTVYVDRARARMRELFAGYESFSVVVSPDRARIAYALSTDALRIHILNLDDFTERDFTFDLTFVNHLTWLDGGSLLLTAVGGN